MTMQTMMRGVLAPGVVLAALAACSRPAEPAAPVVAADPAQTVARPADTPHVTAEPTEGSARTQPAADGQGAAPAEAVELRRLADGQQLDVRKVDPASTLEGARPAAAAPAPGS
ncbi:MAG: hypothetical protein GAK31_02800 [Stenotrophomonas maltophilia]|uniref:Uncharacterized protein n=1 Tax=Stenotrophomonas maltophilia TaxID=40324 RepID=A0A7V8FE90_STEMA|nr:MAG: hypothetical protein GAK31_02800 [Stenotrophomonas maltophilia]